MAKRKKTRHKKGDVVVWERNRMLRLRWRYGGKQQHLALGVSDTPFNREQADRIAIQIKRDIAHDDYDETKDRYRLNHQQAPDPVELTTVELFSQYMEYRREQGTSPQTLVTRYKTLRSHLSHFGRDVATVDDAREVVEALRASMAARTANQVLSLLKGFGRWMVEYGHINESPFETIKPLKGAVAVYKRDAFTADEVNRIMATMQTHPIGRQFYDFTLILFDLGLRPSEAVGLRWKYVDLQGRKVTICEALIPNKVNGHGWVRKSTKTGRSRTLPLNEKLVSRLAGRHSQTVKPDDLIFTDAKGKPLKYDDFRRKAWKPVCQEADVPYRPPYNARHTFISHCIESLGWSLVQVAEMAGHANTQMVAQTYGHMVNVPEMPDF